MLIKYSGNVCLQIYIYAEVSLAYDISRQVESKQGDVNIDAQGNLQDFMQSPKEN